MSYVHTSGKDYALSASPVRVHVQQDERGILTFSNGRGRLYLVDRGQQWVVRTYLAIGGLEETNVQEETQHSADRFLWNRSHLYFFGPEDSGWSSESPPGGEIIKTTMMSKHHIGLLLVSNVLVIINKRLGNIVQQESLGRPTSIPWDFLRNMDPEDDFFLVHGGGDAVLLVESERTTRLVVQTDTAVVPAYASPVILCRSSPAPLVPYLCPLPPICRLPPHSPPTPIHRGSPLYSPPDKERRRRVASMALSLCSTKTIGN